jgi:hypothetical protein
MTRSGIRGAAMLVALALVVVTAAAQDRGQRGRRDPLRGPSTPRASAGPAGHSQVLDLNRRIVEAQQDLWDLKQERAKPEAIDAKRAEVLEYRYELARLLTDLPAGASVAAGPVDPPPPPPVGSAGPAPPRQAMGLAPQARIYPPGPGYRPTAPGGPPLPPRGGATGLGPVMGRPPGTRAYHAGVVYRPLTPMESPPPARMGATGLPPPRVAGGLPRGPGVYPPGTVHRPTGLVPSPRPYPCVRAIPSRVQQSQQQSQGCGQQQQQQQSRGGQQQQQQQGRGGQQQQQQ